VLGHGLAILYSRSARNRARLSVSKGIARVATKTKNPIDVATRVARRREARPDPVRADDSWRRETFSLPRAEAREKAREWFERFPKAAYMTEIESWRELADDRIEFVIRRLPSAD
jgi:hypothetical protein